MSTYVDSPLITVYQYIYLKMSVLFNEANNITTPGLISGNFPDIINTLLFIINELICSNESFEVLSSIDY